MASNSELHEAGNLSGGSTIDLSRLAVRQVGMLAMFCGMCVLPVAAQGYLDPPVITRAEGRDASIYLAWNAVAGAASYYVGWDLVDGSAAGRQESVPGNRTSHTVAGLENGKEYFVWVWGVRANGADGTPSDTVRVTPAASTQPGQTVPPTLDFTCHGYDEGPTRAYNCIPAPSQQHRMRTFVPPVGSACDAGSIAEFPPGRIVFQMRCREGSWRRIATWSYGGQGTAFFEMPEDGFERAWVHTAFSGNSAHFVVRCRAPQQRVIVNELLGASWGNTGTNGIYEMAGCREVEVDTGGQNLTRRSRNQSRLAKVFVILSKTSRVRDYSGGSRRSRPPRSRCLGSRGSR